MSTLDTKQPKTETKAPESSTETKATEPLKKKDCKKEPRTWVEWLKGIKCEDGTGVATDATPKTIVATSNEGSVPAVAANANETLTTASGQPAGPVPPTKAGGWFSRGGKRKSKAKKSRRKNRKQKKSRKSRK